MSTPTNDRPWASVVSLGGNTTCNCQACVLPLRDFLSLVAPGEFTKGATGVSGSPHAPIGRFLLVGDGTFSLDGQRCAMVNYLPSPVQRFVTLGTYVARSLPEYSLYRAAITSKPLVFFGTLSEWRQGQLEDREVAVVLNTRHPSVRRELLGGLDSAIACAYGESYRLTVNLDSAVRNSLHAVLSPSPRLCLRYEAGALFDFAHALGFNRRELLLTSAVSSLSCRGVETRASSARLLRTMLGEPAPAGGTGRKLSSQPLVTKSSPDTAS